jgi:hypothetical protein
MERHARETPDEPRPASTGFAHIDVLALVLLVAAVALLMGWSPGGTVILAAITLFVIDRLAPKLIESPGRARHR